MLAFPHTHTPLCVLWRVTLQQKKTPPSPYTMASPAAAALATLRDDLTPPIDKYLALRRLQE